MTRTLLFRREKTIFLVQRKDIEEGRELINSLSNKAKFLGAFVSLFDDYIAKWINIAGLVSHVKNKELAVLVNKFHFNTAMVKTNVFPRDLLLQCKEREPIHLTEDIVFYFVYSEYYSLEALALELNSLHVNDYSGLISEDRHWRD